MLWNARKNFSPPVDVVETDEHIVILIEIAGMNSEDFNIRLANNYLVIHGVRHRPHIEGKAYHRVEIGFGEFRLDIPLIWSVQQEIVSAIYQDGFLRIDLPRLPEKNIRIVNLTEESISDE